MGTNPVSLGESRSAVDAEVVFPPRCSLSFLLKKLLNQKLWMVGVGKLKM